MRPGHPTNEHSVTIVIPALNEELGLEGAVKTVAEAAEHWFADFEILIFDDGSTDRTGELADRLAVEHARIRAFHHDTPQCIGGVMRRGWAEAGKDYVFWVDGQGATTRDALDRIFAACGSAELVIPFAANQHERPIGRQLIARAFRSTLNRLFGLSLHQYTHLVLCPAAAARRLRVHTDSYAFQAEAVIKLLRSGLSYVEVGVEDNFQIEGRRSKAFRMRNVLGVATFLTRTLWDVYIARDYLIPPAAGESTSAGIPATAEPNRSQSAPEPR